jgi:hypothetical protein
MSWLRFTSNEGSACYQWFTLELCCQLINSYTNYQFHEREFFENLVVAQPFKRCTHIWNFRFITMLTKSRPCFYFLVTTSHRIYLKSIVMLSSPLQLAVASGCVLQVSRPKLFLLLYGLHHHGHEVRQALSFSSKATQ